MGLHMKCISNLNEIKLCSFTAEEKKLILFALAKLVTQILPSEWKGNWIWKGKLIFPICIGFSCQCCFDFFQFH